MSKLNPNACPFEPLGRTSVLGTIKPLPEAQPLDSCHVKQENVQPFCPSDDSSSEHSYQSLMDRYLEENYVIDPDEYDKMEKEQAEVAAEWAPMQSAPTAAPVRYTNAASESQAAISSPANYLPFFSGEKVPETPEEVERFQRELHEMQQRQIEEQLEEERRKTKDRQWQQRRDIGGSYADKKSNLLPGRGNSRWQQGVSLKKMDLSQQTAMESFANALLHAVSPFMAPLRKATNSLLPHIKIDQRFGKRGHPETAVQQFIIAPTVLNYKPTHFHEVSPGDLLEYHHEFALVLKQLHTANSISISYGPIWKRFPLPYCFVGCSEYRKEVLALAPDEVPNERCEAIYEDDVVKDITSIVLAVEELDPLSKMSIAEAMYGRINLIAMYDVFFQLFSSISDYQIIIRHLKDTPSQYLIKTSLHVMKTSCELKDDVRIALEKHEADLRNKVPNPSFAPEITGNSFKITLGLEDNLWEQLPLIRSGFHEEKIGLDRELLRAEVIPEKRIALKSRIAEEPDIFGNEKTRKNNNRIADVCPIKMSNISLAICGISLGITAVSVAVILGLKNK